jgi:hypothetical protein
MAKKPADIWGVPLPSPKDVVQFLNNAVNQGRVASGDKAAILPGDQGVRNLGRGVSIANDYLNPYANTTKQLLGMAAGNPDAEAKFAKSLAKDIAITAAAAGAGVAISKGAKAVQNTGIPARLNNYIKGETVLVHGSPVKGLSEIKPNKARANPESALVYGMRTDVPLEQQKQILPVTEQYARGSTWHDRGQAVPSGGGSIYVTKVPKETTLLPDYPKATRGGTKFNADGRPIIKFSPSTATTSSSSARVVGEIPVAGKGPDQLRAALQIELKKAGVKVKPNIIEKMLDKAEAAKMARQTRIKNKNSVV